MCIRDSYEADMARRHRWIRGDWQIGKWILPFAPAADRKLHKNPLSLFARWKIFDNIRRSLVPMCLLLLLLFGWTISSAAWFWTLAVTIIIILPSIVNFFFFFLRKPPDVIFIQHLAYTSRSALNNFFQQMLELIFLPYEVYSNTDAIIRTLWRMFISKKKLLEWNPYTNSHRSQSNIVRSYNTMWFEPAFAIGLYIYLTVFN